MSGVSRNRGGSVGIGQAFQWVMVTGTIYTRLEWVGKTTAAPMRGPPKKFLRT